ncbi:MAG: sigma-70 family RNA polymerase sigma factor [Burkholderiaceae bacterium]
MNAAEDDAAERALLQRMAQGDRAALAALYRPYHRRLARFLSRMTRRADVIDEVVNDCFWVVWQKAGSFRGDSRVSTWIMGIAYRCALKCLRQHGEDDADLGPGGLDELPDLASDPHAEHELRDWLGKALSRLPADQRLVLELAYGGGHSLEEIAAIVQCPVGTIKARMFHARVKLRNLLPDLAGQRVAAPGARTGEAP